MSTKRKTGIASFECGSGNTMVIEFPNVVQPLKLIANLRRLDSYKGEFGFDWMRDDYKTICKSYEALKAEYTPDEINGQEYFVSWLSMFPNQENVKLKLEVIKNREANDTDIIKLPAKNGIKFEPNEIKVNEVEGKEIKVICESPINEDFDIELLDKNDNKIGKINIFNNKNTPNVKIKFVKVMGNEPDNRYNELTFKDVNKDWCDNLVNDLNGKYFNQAGAKVIFDGIVDMPIDIESYVKKEVLDPFLGSDGKRGIPRYKRGFDKELYKDYTSKNGEYGGIIFFLSSMQQQGLESGHAHTYPRKINYIMITPSSVGGLTQTYGHELGHALGLDHPWEASSKYDLRISKIDKRREYLTKYLEKVKSYPDDTKIKGSDKLLGEVRESIKQEMLDLEQEKSDRQDLSDSLYAFNQASTENYMDYNGYNSGTEVVSNTKEAISFWKWQWEMIKKEIVKYHGS